MNIINQVEISSANFWAGAAMTKAAFQYLKAERAISERDRRVQYAKAHNDGEMRVGHEVLMDELEIITKSPEEQSAEALDNFLSAGTVVYGAYLLAKDTDDPESFHLRNVKTPLQILSKSAEYQRNQQRAATAAALGLVLQVDEPSDALPPQLETLYKMLVDEIKHEGQEHCEEEAKQWIATNRDKIVESIKNLLDGARKRFEAGGFAGDPTELFELRKYAEAA